MTITYFETKTQYLNFRSAWAAACKDKQLTAAHMVLYNIIRGKSPSRGFTPTTRPSKILNGHRINGGYYDAVNYLNQMVKTSYEWNLGRANKWSDNRLTDFLTPIAENMIPGDLENNIVFLKQMLTKIPSADLEVKPLHADFGKGKQIADRIVHEGFKPKTIEDLYQTPATTEEAA